MGRYTAKEFASAVGLEDKYVNATIILKFLCSQGVAKELERVSFSSNGKGRKTVVYGLPDEIKFNIK